MKTTRGILAVGTVILATGLSLGHAQVSSGQIQVSNLRSLQVVEGAALPTQLANAQPVLVESVPECGTFWSLQKLGAEPPFPFDPFPNVPLYSLGCGNYVFDDTALVREAEMEAALQSLERQYGLATTMSSVPSPPGDGDGDGGTNTDNGGSGSYTPIYGSNDLWMGISVANATASFTIHTPETNAVYDLFLTTNLSPSVPGLNLTNWLWLLRTEPGQSNLVVTNLTAAQCFFRLGTTNDPDGDGLSTAFEKLISHSNPTNADTYGNGLPDGWQWNNFGNFNQTASGDYDGDGTNNLAEYQAGTDPNTISFSLSVTNQYVNVNPVPVQLIVLGGVPSSMAVLLDNTNFAAANWTGYTSNLTVNLGSTQGWHDLWIGLRGRMTTSQQTWEWARLYLDTIPPVISITSPANSASFNSSRVNVRGSFTETSLKQITVNGVLAFVSSNSFDALNVPLAGGANTITATAEDFAANIGTASISITGITNADGSLNDPVQLQATPVGGFAPLQVTFQVQPNAPGTMQQVLYDFDGDDIIDLVTNNLQSLTHTYATNGEYFPVVTIQTIGGWFSSLGGWHANFFGETLRINVQAAPVQMSLITITDPVDIKWVAGSNLYVLSGSSATITEFALNGTNATPVRSLAGIGSSPRGLDVDSAGNVYVALSGDNQVAKFKPVTSSFQLDTNFNATGRIGLTNGNSGTNFGEFNAPFDVAVTPDGEEIAVSDSGNHRIQRFTKDGTFIDAFGQQGSALGQFNTPKGLTYDSVGDLYIVDSGNNRIVLAQDSAVMGVSGTNGSALGQFQGAVNLGVGDRGIYVADTGNNRVQAFAPVIGGGIAPTPFNPRLSLSSEFGLSQPNAVAPVADLLEEEIYIADTGNNRVVLVKLPSDNPEATWNVMKQDLVSGEIEGAVSYFASISKEKYRQAFLSIGTNDLTVVISQIPAISPVYIENHTAEYFFTNTIDGQTITFPIEFVKENGIWKIMEF